MKHLRKTLSLAVALPLLAGLIGATAVPQPAFATFGGDSDRGGQGDRPEHRVLTTYELLRLNVDSLLGLTIGPRRVYLTIEGPMGIYSSYYVVEAIVHQRDRARHLIERLERAKTEEEKKEILEGLLRAAERRHKASEARLKKEEKILKAAGLLEIYPDRFAPPEIRNNKRIQAYYAMLRATYSEQRYAEMLDAMLSVHTGRYRTIFD